MFPGPWRVGTTQGNGYGTQGQNYVALPHGSEILAGFHSRNLVLAIWLRLTMLSAYQ